VERIEIDLSLFDNRRKEILETILKAGNNNYRQALNELGIIPLVTPKARFRLNPITCYQYVLGLDSFNRLQQLLDNGQFYQPGTGIIAVYYTDDLKPEKVNHLGKMKNKQEVVSKFGKLGLFQHNITDVPIIYGNRVTFIKEP